MKFFQLFSKENSDGNFSENLLNEFKDTKAQLTKKNLENSNDFQKLLNINEKLRNEIDNLVKKIPKNFDELSEPDKEKTLEEIKWNKRSIDEYKKLSKIIDELEEGNTENLSKLPKQIENLSSNLSNTSNGNATSNMLSPLSDNITNSVQNNQEFGSVVQNLLKGSMTNLVKSISWTSLGTLAFEGLKWGLTNAGEHINELNEELIGLERATGGVITASTLNMTTFGKVEGTWKNLRTAAIKANVSIEQITTALKEFATIEGDFGAIGGGMIRNDINTKKQLEDFGIESARIKKLYNADIIPAVQTMFKDWGYSIEDATDSMIDGVRTMRLEGLNPEQWSKNMADVVKLSSKMTFKNGIQGMKNIATMASKLGVSVNAIVNGFSDMQGFTDVFERQAEMSALGMKNYGTNLSKIYALRKTGKHDEASALEIQSLSYDLRDRGLIDQNKNSEFYGQVTQEGKEFLSKMGLDDEQIQAMQQQTRIATLRMKELGWSLQDALKPLDKLNEEQKKQAEQIERNNITIKESIDKVKNEMKDQVIGRIADLLIPLLEGVASFFGIKTEKQMLQDKIKNSGLDTNTLIKIHNKENPDNIINEKTKNEGTSFGMFASSLAGGALGSLLGPAGTVSGATLGAGIYKSFSHKTGLNDLTMGQRANIEGTYEAFKGWDEEKQNEYLKSIGLSDKQVKEYTESLKKLNKETKKEQDLKQDNIKLEAQKKKEFITRNINEALDRAMRDIVTYGKVGKSPKVSSLNEQYEKQNNSSNTNTNNKPIVVGTKIEVNDKTYLDASYKAKSTTN